MARIDEEAAEQLPLPGDIPAGGARERSYRRGAADASALLRSGYYQTQELDAHPLWHGNLDTLGDPRRMTWRGLVLDSADAQAKLWDRRN